LAVCLFAAIVWLIASRIDAPSIAAAPDLYTWFETIAPMATGWVAAGLVVSAIVTIVSLRMVRVK
jgi:type IV secretory pathway VirB2 component (pilin)